MNLTGGLPGDQPQPQKKTGECAGQIRVQPFPGVQIDVLHHVIRIHATANLIAEPEVNHLPQSRPMQRERGLKLGAITRQQAFFGTRKTGTQNVGFSL